MDISKKRRSETSTVGCHNDITVTVICKHYDITNVIDLIELKGIDLIELKGILDDHLMFCD
jgi:hypothetical protein